MKGEMCRCGHVRNSHRFVEGRLLSPCQRWCDCMGFDRLVEPKPGERPVFGVHRVRHPWSAPDEPA